MTKLQLLNQISEADIFSKYVPGFIPSTKKNYKSPFSDKDNKPSLSIYKEGSSLKFKSHNTGHQGDVFQFVADINKIDAKKNFSQVIEIIAKDFSLNGFSKKSKISENVVFPVSSKKQNVKISFEKEQTEDFLKYFAAFKIDAATLLKFDVNPVKYHEFYSSEGKLCKFDYRKSNQLAICYSINKKVKIYFPAIAGKQERSFGFKDQTTSDIFGLKQLTKSKILWICAGEKDCLAMNSNGFPAISFQSETTIPTAEQIALISSYATTEARIIYDNDKPGKEASQRLSKLTGWKSFCVQDGFKDVADFFREKSPTEFKPMPLVPDKAKENSPGEEKDEDDQKEIWTIFHETEKFLSRNFDLRFNTIKLEHEIKRKNETDFRPLNENSLFVEMNKAGVKVGMDKLICILKSDFIEKYNPFIHYFSNLPKWDGVTDHIGHLASFISTNDDLNFAIQFTKWMMRCVKCATIGGYYNKQAFILIHNKQNSGKTTFCRFLCPPALSEYLAENISDDKDSKIAIAKNFLINLDELSSLAKHEINSLKALFSKDIINERLPYDRKTSIIHRVASFIGSTNMAEFLTDETGSVRWLCFEIKSINWKYSKEVDINKCWAQAVGMIKEKLQAEMDHKEIEENEVRNAKFQQRSTEAELIPNYLKPAVETDRDAIFLTASDILLYLSTFTSLRLNKVSIGRAMPTCGFHRTKESGSDRYGYFAIKLK
ncbi:MAG: hypothetical protein M3Z26_00405 [Bacteroidota bacterium]|nr:hypothetical protein [Bacteroidota bacterium]